MQQIGTLKTLWHLLAARVRGTTHQERLESFYSGQADGYDDFRRKLLHGRREMIEALPIAAGGAWVDIGAGTGANAEFLGDRIALLKQVYQVDLCGPLLKVARDRAAERGWSNVATVEADATSYVPPQPVDLVTFSYSLTMIPDWFAAIENAFRMLKPGGTIGVVDFYVSRKYPEAKHVRHRWSTRVFWSTWFAFDNVFLSGDHLPFLERRFETLRLEERRGKVPFLPLARAPYYIYLGRKPGGPG
jgi:S-adenosylmethionine-diacylgycerolhomoserine-N-methlytransferase